MGRQLTFHEPDGLAEVLRREAAGERPTFSEALHGRILRGLPAQTVAPVVIKPAEPRFAGVGRPAWWPWSLAAAGAALVAVAVVIVATGPTPLEAPPRSVALATAEQAGSDEATAEAVAAGAAGLGIERVPMFDELEAGVREGVSTLAATLLDVPEWRMLADFDAAGFLGEDSAR